MVGTSSKIGHVELVEIVSGLPIFIRESELCGNIMPRERHRMTRLIIITEANRRGLVHSHRLASLGDDMVNFDSFSEGSTNLFPQHVAIHFWLTK